ncbi:restriction endonuclease subunit S [Aliarcobacter butzleri]|uniref:restriction endonuclease subunit S n=1 Tax=Aliarcobacter butzleri TaxID=28197 RepID=UPI002B2507F1|nr:restriction endonuclease subunit S [Aliarcobacter butzleri]
MSKTISLKKVAKYSDARIPIKNVTIDNFVTTDNLLQNKLGITKATSLPPQDGNMPAYFKNNILIGNIRPYLKKIWFADKDGGNSADVLTIKVNEKHNPKFIYYALYRDDFFEHMMKGSKGTKMPRGDKNQIMDFSIPDISLESEEKIANVLSSLDSKIELNNKINKELETMAKTLYDYWFVQFDFPNENGKPYKSSGGKMVYNQELKREIPEGWEVDSLWNIATYFNGLAMQKHRPKNDNKLRVIKIKEMNEGFGDYTEYAKADVQKEAIINNGDILFSWSASLDVIIWAKGIGALNQHIFKVTSKKYPRSFYYYELINYLKHFKMMADLRKTTMGHITQEHLKQSKIVIPPIDLIMVLDSKINVFIEKQILLQQQNQELAKLRDWLLPMLMNGQVRVK